MGSLFGSKPQYLEHTTIQSDPEEKVKEYAYLDRKIAAILANSVREGKLKKQHMGMQHWVYSIKEEVKVASMEFRKKVFALLDESRRAVMLREGERAPACTAFLESLTDEEDDVIYAVLDGLRDEWVDEIEKAPIDVLRPLTARTKGKSFPDHLAQVVKDYKRGERAEECHHLWELSLPTGYKCKWCQWVISFEDATRVLNGKRSEDVVSKQIALQEEIYKD